MQDLVTVGVPDAGDDALAPQEALDLLGTGTEDLRQGIDVEPRTERVRSERRDPGHVVRIPDHIDRHALFRAGLRQIHAERAGPAGEGQPRRYVALAHFQLDVVGGVGEADPAGPRQVEDKYSPSASTLTNLPKRRTR